jgi:N-methylhydantoinase A/oxoprolinase/acetone carboxylase beta subunit
MRIGLDVGGTHTDAVLIDTNGLMSTAKVPTDHADLTASVLAALNAVIPAAEDRSITSINLSTTLTTNAILEGKTEPTGVFVSGGPGIDPLEHRIGDCFFVLDGSIDHRGVEQERLDADQLADAVNACRKNSVKAYAVISKFSPRNPAHEQRMEAALEGQADFITAGHRMAGRLNFPRRIATAGFNAAVWRIFNAFADAVETAMKTLKTAAPVSILKADSGTMTLDTARTMPVQSILSGPAASILGIAALCTIREDAVLLDIGGTSTDIALFAAGTPLLVPEGISINNRPTLVRALQATSIAIGGDSVLRSSEDGITVGPDRKGACMALGGPVTTLMDACVVAGLSSLGDTVASRAGFATFAAGTNQNQLSCSQSALATAITAIKSAVDALVTEVNDRPVYTVHEMLHPERIMPKKLYVVGGPAQALAGLLAEAFGYEVVVPPHASVANAIGAALARTTFELELFADTARGVKLIPQLGIAEEVDRHYSLDDAKHDARAALLATLGDSTNAEVQFLEASSFNRIQGGRMTGKDLRVQCQIKPALDQTYINGLRNS